MESLLTVHEAAVLLRLSDAAVYALCKSGQLPHHRLGKGKGAIRIDRVDVLAYRQRLQPPDSGNPEPPLTPGSPEAELEAKHQPGEGDVSLAARIEFLSNRIATLSDQLARMEAVLNLLVQERAGKDWYTPGEVAQILGKVEFTVREWCRLGRVRAEKKGSGRGRYHSWVISHAELQRIQKEGLLPVRRGPS